MADRYFKWRVRETCGVCGVQGEFSIMVMAHASEGFRQEEEAKHRKDYRAGCFDCREVDRFRKFASDAVVVNG